MWILTFEVYHDNQHGEYFHTAYLTKPTIEELMEVSIPLTVAESLLKVGEGHQNPEDEWYSLKEYQHGE